LRHSARPCIDLITRLRASADPCETGRIQGPHRLVDRYQRAAAVTIAQRRQRLPDRTCRLAGARRFLTGLYRVEYEL
jgi:hypothetical protein